MHRIINCKVTHRNGNYRSGAIARVYALNQNKNHTPSLRHLLLSWNFGDKTKLVHMRGAPLISILLKLMYFHFLLVGANWACRAFLRSVHWWIDLWKVYSEYLRHFPTSSSWAIFLPGGSTNRTDARSLSNVGEVIHVNRIKAKLGYIGTCNRSSFTVNDIDNTSGCCKRARI